MKKQILTGSLLIFTIAIMTGCGETKHAGHEGHATEHSEVVQENTLPNDIRFKDEVTGQIFNDYILVKTALVEGKSAVASEHAQKIVSASASMEFEGKEAAEKISGSSDLEVQRAAFEDLSAAVEQAITGQLASGAVYKQYCPMAFEGKGGYWLSDQEAIRNPYYGDKMLKCGRVEKVLGER